MTTRRTLPQNEPMTELLIRLKRAGLVLAVLIGCLQTGGLPAAAGDLSVFAAASLKTALDRITDGFTEETGHQVAVSYAGTSALARQIAHGAPADIFIAANADWMDYLEAEGLVAPGSRFDLVGNTLVLIAHGADAEPLEIAPGMALADRLGDSRLAMAFVDAVPAGIYGKAALQTLGVWEEVSGQVAQADNVRAALALVATGEAPLGIVYASDVHANNAHASNAEAGDAVSIIGRFPEGSHPPITYPAAATADSGNPLNQPFLEHLRSARSQAVFADEGFVVLDE